MRFTRSFTHSKKWLVLLLVSFCVIAGVALMGYVANAYQKSSNPPKRPPQKGRTDPRDMTGRPPPINFYQNTDCSLSINFPVSFPNDQGIPFDVRLKSDDPDNPISNPNGNRVSIEIIPDSTVSMPFTYQFSTNDPDGTPHTYNGSITITNGIGTFDVLLAKNEVCKMFTIAAHGGYSGGLRVDAYQQGQTLPDPNQPPPAYAAPEIQSVTIGTGPGPFRHPRNETEDYPLPHHMLGSQDIYPLHLIDHSKEDCTFKVVLSQPPDPHDPIVVQHRDVVIISCDQPTLLLSPNKDGQWPYELHMDGLQGKSFIAKLAKNNLSKVRINVLAYRKGDPKFTIRASEYITLQ